MRKGLQTTELRRLMGTRAISQVIFLENTDKGVKLGLQIGISVEPGLNSVPGPDGKVLDGYVVTDTEAVDSLVAAADKQGVYCEQYSIPSVPKLATRLLRKEDLGLNMREQRIIGRVVSSFLDIATTGMGRGTHYNTKEDQIKAERLAHAAMFNVDRQTYGILSCLSGLTDNARKLVCWFLLEWPDNGTPTQTELEGERELVKALVQSITVPRMFQLFEMLLDSGCNNSRTRRVMLSAILSSPNIEWWSVKYRRKMQRALKHAWGKRLASTIHTLGRRFADNGANTVLGPKEKQILQTQVVPYLGANDLATVCECVAFVISRGSSKEEWSRPLFQSYIAARTDLAAGKTLPPEVLEGIRSVYHKGTKKEEIVKISAKSGSMTAKQKIQVQTRAEKAGVTITFDPNSYDATRLYLYAFERKLDDNIRKALDEKARKSAAQLPIDCDGAVVLVDASRSMFGDQTQKLRPMATALAMRDMFIAAGAKAVIVGGKGKGRMVFPSGDTSLALPFAKAIRDHNPTAVYVISDGYENTPAGRFAETVRAVRKIGITIPIYHLNPVAAAETASVRQLAPGIVPTMPVQNPSAFGASLLREAMEQDPLAGVRALLKQARALMLDALTGKKALQEATTPRKLSTGGKPSKAAAEAAKVLSPPMATAMIELYRATPDKRGLVKFRGIINESTVSALGRRGLVKVAGADFVKHTDIGRQTATILSR